MRREPEARITARRVSLSMQSSAARGARTSVARMASTTLRLKPHLGSAGEPGHAKRSRKHPSRSADLAATEQRGAPFMKSMTGAEASSARMRVLTSTTAGAAGASAALSSVALSSPLPAISSTMSQPPVSSPRTYSCGYVGQLL